MLGNPALGLVELVNSVNGLYARRTNLALGVSTDLLQQTPPAAVALVLALYNAARWLPAHMPEAATLLDGRVAGMRQDEILQMMRHEVLGISPVGNDLKTQIARYVDELKLLGLFPDSSIPRATHAISRPISCITGREPARDAGVTKASAHVAIIGLRQRGGCGMMRRMRCQTTTGTMMKAIVPR